MEIQTINDIGFEHGGTWIVNPTTSECSRFPASPDYYGFAVVDTGGNCTAWRKDLPDGTYLMLTDAQGVSHNFDFGAEMLLGLYRAADEHGEYVACKTLLAGTCETTDDDAPRSRLI